MSIVSLSAIRPGQQLSALACLCSSFVFARHLTPATADSIELVWNTVPPAEQNRERLQIIAC